MFKRNKENEIETPMTNTESVISEQVNSNDTEIPTIEENEIINDANETQAELITNIVETLETKVNSDMEEAIKSIVNENDEPIIELSKKSDSNDITKKIDNIITNGGDNKIELLKEENEKVEKVIEELENKKNKLNTSSYFSKGYWNGVSDSWNS